ncbi:receptor-transporting protein 4 isoform X3 [Psammomys obesus]|uniref:receptor-transporting protein 4 isoform X3 n=1 Tax=Psammomys obesus TaxID=48139 RepID=UPI002453298B|nr:receptor-transporting protein 4 isoform X3 [Psammomys obesus]
MLFSDFSPWEQTFQDLIQEEKPGAYWTLQLSRNIVPNAAAVGWRQYQQTVPGSVAQNNMKFFTLKEFREFFSQEWTAKSARIHQPGTP